MTYKLLLTILSFCFLIFPDTPQLSAQSKIEWMSWEEGLRQSKKEEKPLLIKIHRKGCNWCKQMDESTFQEKAIIDYISANYIAVDLPFDEKQGLEYKSKSYNYVTSKGHGYHELALDLSGGRFGTPGIVFMDKKMEVVQSFIGYKNPKKFMAILQYFGEGFYLRIPWHKFNQLYVKE